MIDAAKKNLAVLRARGVEGPLDAAIVLGTGLGDMAARMSEAVSISYGELQGFPAPTVSGHAGRLVVGRCGGRRVAFLQGRGHYYENGDMLLYGMLRDKCRFLDRKAA